MTFAKCDCTAKGWWVAGEFRIYSNRSCHIRDPRSKLLDPRFKIYGPESSTNLSVVFAVRDVSARQQPTTVQELDLAMFYTKVCSPVANGKAMSIKTTQAYIWKDDGNTPQFAPLLSRNRPSVPAVCCATPSSMSRYLCKYLYLLG